MLMIKLPNIVKQKLIIIKIIQIFLIAFHYQQNSKVNSPDLIFYNYSAPNSLMR